MSTLVRLDQHLAGQRVDLDDALDLVAPELDAHGDLLVGREDLERVAAHAELAAREVDVVALVVDVGQEAQHLVALARLALAQRHRDLVVLLAASRGQ